MRMEERLENVSFTREFTSRFMKPMRLSFEQGCRKRVFDLALSHCSVATLLYHKEFKKFLIVRQFRPAVFIGRVSKFPENNRKKFDDIDWSQYDTSLGYTIELCAGLVDKDLPIKDIAREEIEEECGYAVSTTDIQYLASYTVDADESGSTQYLFYAEIDESMKLNEGGGNVSEGESITKVFLDVSEAHTFVKDTESHGPPGVFYALSWWFHEKELGSSIENESESSFRWNPNMDGEEMMRNLSFQKDCKSNRYHPVRMSFKIGQISRIWDLAPCEDSVAVYVYNKDTDSIMFTQRFRPAVLVGRTLHHPLNKLVDPSTVDWAKIPSRLAYTLEMCCTHTSTSDSQEEKARESVRTKLGYKLKTLEYVTSFILGISLGGDRQRIYYAEVSDADKVENWSMFEDVKPVSIPVASLPALFHQPSPISPPAVLYMTQWFMKRRKGF